MGLFGPSREEIVKGRYEENMPIVKKYFDSIGFELPANENVLFMKLSDDGAFWNFDHGFDGTYRGERPANGMLLTPSGNAFLGEGKYYNRSWFGCYDKYDDKNVSKLGGYPKIQNILIVGNIKSQLVFNYGPKNSPKDVFRFENSVKRIFILPLNKFEKKNTVELGEAFSECTNLQLFFSGFEKITAKCEVFADNTHAEFIAPSETSFDFFNSEPASKDWDFKVGTTIQNAVSVKEMQKAAEEKAKAETEAKSKAESAEKANTLAETKAVLEQLESDLAAKKAEVASLGLDAQGIVQKAKLNKEIKELEPQIETLKAEVERLSK